MAKKNYFLQIFFIFLSLFSLFKLYDNSAGHDAWQYGEWLINYQYGFVRRGLVGEIIFLFSNLLENNIQIAFLIMISSACILYYYFSYQLLKQIKFNFIHYFILFSPLFYFFFVVISKVGVKKEILLYLFYIIYLLNLSSKNYNLSNNWKYFLTYFLLLFNHEVAFFYLPYLILPLLFVIKKNNLRNFIFQIFFLGAGSLLIIIILYYNKGSLEHTLSICRSLESYAPMKCDWWGPIYALSNDLFVNNENVPNIFFYLTGDFNTNISFAFYIFYSFIPIIIFLNFSYINFENLTINKNIFLYLCILTFLFSLPLFHMAEDWSRWFSIHIHLISFFIFYLYRNKLIHNNKSSKFRKIDDFLLGKKFKNYFMIILFIFATAFHHHHFFFKGVKLEFTYYKIFKKIGNSF